GYEARHVPLFLDRLGRNVEPRRVLDPTGDHVTNRLRDVIGLQQLVALLVDHAPLIVGYVVVLEQLLADVEVSRLDAVLGLGDRAVDDRVLDGLALGHLQPLHDPGQAFAAEDAQEWVFQGEIEPRRTRVTLAAGTSTQLIVDSSRFVAFGADDVQPPGRDDRVVANLPFAAELPDLQILLGLRERFVFPDLEHQRLDCAAEDEVGAAARHVGGDGDHLRPPGSRDDLGFARVLLA